MRERQQGVTLLWALRSPCNLQCQYCYFGTLETSAPTHVGALSHRGHRDVTPGALLAFIRTCSSTLVRRVFLAGGEPLVCLGTRRIIPALKTAGCEVIVCTNGLPLQRDDLCRFLLEQEVDAVSVSLDSSDPETNDHWRKDRSGQGWQGVVAGIQNLIRWRNAGQAPMQIGVYSVLTRHTLPQLADTGKFVAGFGADYVIPQPVSLAVPTSFATSFAAKTVKLLCGLRGACILYLLWLCFSSESRSCSIATAIAAVRESTFNLV